MSVMVRDGDEDDEGEGEPSRVQLNGRVNGSLDHVDCANNLN